MMYFFISFYFQIVVAPLLRKYDAIEQKKMLEGLRQRSLDWIEY